MSKNEMIDMHDVARIFDLSIEGVRKYKRDGLFEACKRVGRKDFYNMHEILRIKDLVQSYKLQGFSLKKIKEKIAELKSTQNLKVNLDSSHDVKKVLIIEDEESVINLLKDIFKTYFNKDEIKIFDAKMGRLGIETAEIIRPDLIILDMALPDISGEEVHERLKNNPNTSQTKIIVISGVMDFSDNARFKTSNDKFFMKPLKIKDFLDQVRIYLEIETDF